MSTATTPHALHGVHPVHGTRGAAGGREMVDKAVRPDGTAGSGPCSYGLAMTEWPEGWRPSTTDDAQGYLDAHPPGTGDDEIAAACTSLLDQETLAPRPGSPATVADGASFPKPSDDQLEEKGAD
jgi:hypothetical protein